MAPTPDTKFTEQHILNRSYDELLETLVFQLVGYIGIGVQCTTARDLSFNVTTSGVYTYVCKAAPGTALSAPLWQVKRIDSTTGARGLWADGDANFDNVATAPSGLTYS